MAFKIPKATSADDIAVWLSGAKQQLDDYFAQLPASQWDEYVPLQKANPDIPVLKYQNLEAVARQAGKNKGLQDDALDNYVLEQMRPHLVTLTPEERAKEIQLLIEGEKRNYLQDIEQQAKRLGYQPQKRRVAQAISGGDIDDSFVPENTPTQGRTSKAGGTILNGTESKKEMLAKMKAAGKAWDSVNQQWADKSTLRWDDSIRKFVPKSNQPQSISQEVPRTTAPIPIDNGAIAPVAVISTQPGMEVVSKPEVIVSVPQYEGSSRIEDAPPSGVNLLADGYQSGTSAGIPMTGSNVPPNKPPGSGNYNFEGGEFNRGVPQDNSRYYNVKYPQGNTPDQPFIPGMQDFVDAQEAAAKAQAFKEMQDAANTGNYWQNLWDGTKKGFQYGTDAGKYEGRTASAVWNRAPDSQYAHLQNEGRVGFGVGRVVGDVVGNGSRQILWNLQPADFVGTHGAKFLGEDATRMAKVVVPFAAVTGLELGSQIYNPFNLAEGGRVAGYQAINPDEDDPRISTSPLSDLLIDRGLLGKRGRLLPWEQFRQERTDIPYEQYEKYQDYLRNKDENFLRDATGGLIKGTMDGINGPELSVMGYSVTPTGALAAGAALLAGREIVRSGRIAGFRK